MKRLPIIALMATTTLALAACAGESRPSTAGERISERGSTIAEYGDEWSTGQAQAERGRAMVAESTNDADRASRRLAEAREVIAAEEGKLRAAESARIDGERLISDGTADMARAEAEYAAIRRAPSATQ